MKTNPPSSDKGAEKNWILPHEYVQSEKYILECVCGCLKDNPIHITTEGGVKDIDVPKSPKDEGGEKNCMFQYHNGYKTVEDTDLITREELKAIIARHRGTYLELKDATRDTTIRGWGFEEALNAIERDLGLDDDPLDIEYPKE